MRTARAIAIAIALLSAPALLAPGCRERGRKEAPFATGLEVLAAEGFAGLRGRRVGVVTNPTGVDRRLRWLPDIIAALPGVTLGAILGPEHGARGAAAAGVHLADEVDPRTGVPVFSLYGSVRRPTPRMLEGLDVILFDMQDIGVRAYTYLSTLKEVLAACAESGKELWVLDRPVPIGGDVLEGPVLEAGFESFVGPHRTPLRHGLTAGEFALMVNEEAGVGANLKVCPMSGYRRGLEWPETSLPWVPPSPNIPAVETALAYAGAVLVEGTNLSEGRGTALPFLLVGAPWINGETLAAELERLALPGCLFRPAVFTPTASKHAGTECGGVQLHVTAERAFRSVAAAVALIQSARRLWPREFAFLPDAFDRLAGTSSLRRAIEADVPLADIVRSWEQGIEEFRRRRQRFLLYPE
jgi:uncharacterized protein YbbC (DUF1343 family)